MSGQIAQDPAAAQAVLFQDVYLPAFAEKCATLGVAFADEESVQAALETVSMLKQASQAKTGNLVKSAHAALCEAAGRQTPKQRAKSASQAKVAADTAKSERIKQALSTLA